MKDEEERPPEAAGVVVEVGETRTGLCHPGCRLGIQSEPDNREARCGPYPIHGPARLAFKWKEKCEKKMWVDF